MTNPESRDAVPASAVPTTECPPDCRGDMHHFHVADDRPAPHRHKCVECGDWLIDNERELAEARQDSLDEVERLRTALTALVRKMDHVHDSEAYKAHWFAGHAHVGPYSGPTYTDELDAARALTTTEAKPKP